MRYGVATMSSIDKFIGLFCRIASLLWGSFVKENYNCIDPTNMSHPIASICILICGIFRYAYCGIFLRQL